MAIEKMRIIGALFVAILASGLCMIFAGKVLHMPLAIVHKLLSVLCLVLLLRNAGTLRAFQAPAALPVWIIVFAVAFLAAFVSGAVQSIPACANAFWLNLHRVTSAVAAIGCAMTARLITMAIRT
jgi:hypothetical protein